MAKISEERLQKYRELANKPSMEMDNTEVRAIFRRMEDEGANVRDMRDKNVGMYMAPYSKEISDMGCVHLQIGKSYNYKGGLNSEAFDLVSSISK